MKHHQNQSKLDQKNNIFDQQIADVAFYIFKMSCNAITKLIYSKQYNDFVPRRTHMLPVAAVTGRTTGLQTTTLGISMVVLVRATPAKVRHGYCATTSDWRGFKDFFENMETELQLS